MLVPVTNKKFYKASLEATGTCGLWGFFIMQYNFKDQYSHPKWQKKRLEILERDHFMCQLCYDTEKQLHVHHWHYTKNTEIWDYHDDNFITLCSDCHKNIHVIKKDIKYIIDKSFNNDDILNILKDIIINISKLSIHDIKEINEFINKKGDKHG